MGIMIDPMPGLRQQRIDNVNQAFATHVGNNVHRHLAHERKRQQAEAIVNGGTPGASFSAEADLRGLIPIDLAYLVLSKSSELDDIELKRQQILSKIQVAKTPEELMAVRGDF